jgi:hypothetical protein
VLFSYFGLVGRGVWLDIAELAVAAHRRSADVCAARLCGIESRWDADARYGAWLRSEASRPEPLLAPKPAEELFRDAPGEARVGPPPAALFSGEPEPSPSPVEGARKGVPRGLSMR